jgi:hypothetical protein
VARKGSFQLFLGDPAKRGEFPRPGDVLEVVELGEHACLGQAAHAGQQQKFRRSVLEAAVESPQLLAVVLQDGQLLLAGLQRLGATVRAEEGGIASRLDARTPDTHSFQILQDGFVVFVDQHNRSGSSHGKSVQQFCKPQVGA